MEDGLNGAVCVMYFCEHEIRQWIATLRGYLALVLNCIFSSTSNGRIRFCDELVRMFKLTVLTSFKVLYSKTPKKTHKMLQSEYEYSTS